MESAINERIYNWLQSSEDYNEGLELYSKVCKNRSLFSRLMVSANDFNTNKLHYELDKYLDSTDYDNTETEKQSLEKDIKELKEETCSKSNTKHESEHRTGSKSISKPSKKVYDANVVSFRGKRNHVPGVDLSGVVLSKISELTTERNDLYAKRDSLHGEMHGTNSKARLYELSHQIQGVLFPELERLNRIINEMKESNVIPYSIQDQKLATDKYKEFINAKSYINRYKIKVKTAETIKERDNALKFLDKYQKQFDELNIKFNGPSSSI